MNQVYENSREFAQKMDQQDPLKNYRNEFHIPVINGKQVIYYTGNSLGLQPKRTRSFIEKELKDWELFGVEGHFNPKKDNIWYHFHTYSKKSLSAIMGAKPEEVVSMNNLTVNLHLLMVSFYRPTAKKYKIIVEAGAFPSDQYVFESQLNWHAYHGGNKLFDPKEALVEIAPRKGERNLRTEDIIETIQKHSGELALVLIGGVQYYTGQFFNLKAITEAAHKAGAYAGFDLAHAAGNINLKLHDWDVDFATWCTYKYLNSGPGNVSGIYVHERFGNNPEIPRFAGWWGHSEQERFKMKKGFIPMEGADGWQLSNVNIIGGAAHIASLEIFAEAGMEALRKKSVLLTGYLEYLIKEVNKEEKIFELITPENPEERGCQLSLLTLKYGKALFDELMNRGILGDWREPDVIRLAPVPLYNTFEEQYQFSKILKESLEALKQK
ncbi:kynureninase [Marivirga sp. S37H4]|uniref:Kynureninase n=1 Tax=Marivirga aurantiaca TaxID=2802615 RepID=A0A935CB65_9BACT|nr:kynureninase [Marivirga aurantiaca]MBK6266607.1 kynureninase [Marivirga aurantiaca]